MNLGRRPDGASWGGGGRGEEPESGFAYLGGASGQGGRGGGGAWQVLVCMRGAAAIAARASLNINHAPSTYTGLHTRLI